MVKINLIIFSISSSISEIRNCISEINNSYPIYFLTPHVAYSNEIKAITEGFEYTFDFISFYQFINQEEMEYCDIEADKIIVQEYSKREGKLLDYYNKIKELKNKIIFNNLSSNFDIQNGCLLSNDLGIDSSVWLKNGFLDKVKYVDSQIKNSFFSKIKNFVFNKIECNILKTSDESYFLLGKASRTMRYLNKEIELIKLSKLDNLLFNLVYKISILVSKKLPLVFLLNLCIKILKRKYIRINTMIVPVHEHTDSYSNLAKFFLYEYNILQDGYLPSYYTSAYLKYWENVNNYYIWDRLSSGIFKRHSLSYRKWTGYKKQTLKSIKLEDDFKIKKVVFLSSGAGDWTALKNRSDEDLIFLALIETAKAYPDINFLYRPHPLWLHHKHQGINSIQRCIDFLDSIKLSNFIISAGAQKEGLNFQSKQSLSTASTTIDNDIDTADIVFGDHSQSMITAAKRGKIMASISLANREEFFSNYSKLGFPAIRTKSEISEFLSLFKDKYTKNEFLQNYNNAIEMYNKDYN